MIKNILIIMIFCVGIFSYGQTQTIKGKLINKETQLPVENATIVSTKNNTIAISNSNGEFSIETTENEEVIISHVSFKKVTILLKEGIQVELLPAQIELNEILVKSNPFQDIAQSTIINDTEKRISQPRSVGHLFRDIKGFGITKRGAYSSEPVFRAFKYEQLNMQYDGGFKILNACPNRMDPITTHVIPEEIEKIEIIKGPFTGRFGQNFGGVINLVSKNPSKYEKGLHGSVEGGFETNGNNLVSGATVFYVADKFDLNVNGSYREFGDYEDGNGTEVPSSFRTTDYSIKVGFNPTTNQRLQVSWRQSFGRDIDHAGLPMDSPFDDSLLLGFDYKWSDISEKIESFTAKVYHSYVDHLMTNEGRPNFALSESSSPVEVWMYGGRSEIVFKTSENSRLYTGVDANLINRQGNRTRIVKAMNGMILPQPMVFVDKIWQDATLNDIGLFAESKFILSDNYTLTTGLRADIVSAGLDDPAVDFQELYGGEIKDQNETNISANASVKYKKNDFQAQLAIGRGVRTANMIERFINHFAVGVDPFEYVGNPYLKPEINTQIELSALKKYGKASLEASVFYSFLTDYIQPIVNENIPRKFMPTVQPTVAKQFMNVDKAYQTGFELAFDYMISNDLVFTSDFSYTYAQNEDLDEPLAQIPPFMVNLGLKYEKDTYWMAINSRIVGDQNRNSASFMEPETPGFGTVDIRVGFEPFEHFSIGAAVLNVFDRSYYEHLNFSFTNSDILSERIFEPGRNITTYIKYSF